MQTTIKRRQKAFTLVEIILAVAIIFFLAGMVIIAINPAKQLAQTRNSQRDSDVQLILNQVYQYSIDNNSALPGSIPTSADCGGVASNEICRTDIGSPNCSGLVDISILTVNQKYLVDVPVDPSGSSANGTGYHISKDADSRITVCAPSAERGVEISATK